jgi:hypothetical protein
MQESSYDQYALVKECGIDHAKYNETNCVFIDVGISQINYKTIQSYDFTVYQLLNDLEYAVNAGAEVLSWFKKKYSRKEPKNWYCRYNVGTAKYSKIKKSCLKYVRLVARYK